MIAEGIYKIEDFEFDTSTGRLWRGDPAAAAMLGEYETRLLMFLLEEYGKSSARKGYNDKIIGAVWGSKGAEDHSLTKLIQILREAFGPERLGWAYIKSNPYRLEKKPTLLRVIGGGSSHDRCECCNEVLGVIADLRSGRCLVSSRVRNDTWAESGFPQWNVDPLRNDDHRHVLPLYLFPMPDHDRDSNQRVVLMTGIDDPTTRGKFSEQGGYVASRYINAFRTSRIQRVEDLENLKRNDALVLLGSHEVNPKARQYVGDPRKHSPTHQIKGSAAKAIGYEAELPWAIFTPEDAREINILQTRENVPVLHKTKDHIIHSLEGTPLRSDSGKDGGRDVWLTDYLLITALPTDATEQRRVISFIGLHLTGTLAAGKLLSEPPKEILKTIHERLGGYQYFQALIALEVDNSRSGQGRAQPGRWIDVKVAPIPVRKLATRK